MDLLLWLAVFGGSLFGLLKSSDWFVSVSEKLGRLFNVPEFVIGVTIVAMGTSLPELASSIAAIFKGESSIVAGNAVGSNITNIFLVFGMMLVVSNKIKLKRDLVNIDLPLLLCSAVLCYFLIKDGEISILDSIVLLLGLIIFIMYTIKGGTDSAEEVTEDEEISEEPEEDGFFSKSDNKLVLFGLAALFAVGIFLSSTGTVLGITKLSEIAGISSGKIALTLVALGTSLPELFVSIRASARGMSDIAIGNIIGSNIFNTFAVLGIPSLIASLHPDLSGLEIIPEVIDFSLLLMIAATVLMFFMCMSKKLSRWEGLFLLVFYVFYNFQVINS